ncbi:transposable element Tcb1 transposase [Elysia marginata]|uniref:Transposable element Tcb1 transposase n=1 Tax=Elysia marginata TaxID=1093978 RepID=A0AAV4IU88_9GAST|nr:transposable element Tcb1 transposase [Elysia marginata]
MHRKIAFQQDNARAHTARYTQQFLDSIEHLWDYLQRRLDCQDHRPQNIDDLEHSLHRHRNAIPRHFLQTPVSLMGRQRAAVLEAQEGNTHDKPEPVLICN